MHFELTADQHEIGRTAKDFLAARFSLQRVQDLADARQTDVAASREIAALGWVTMILPEALGGAGLGLVELVTIQEQLGYALAPVTYLSDLAATLFLAQCRDDDVRDRWLVPTQKGETRGAVGVAGTDDHAFIPGADEADFVVLLSDGGATLYAREEVDISAVETVDGTRRYARVVPTGPGIAVEGDSERLKLMLSLAVAAESVGVAARMVEAAATYARERQQFGQPIGVHQAVAHRCARMLLMTESARSLVQYAAWAGDSGGSDFELAVCSAKAFASECGWRVPAHAIQVHGGIGFSWEHPAHRFLKRGRVNAELYITGTEATRRVSSLITA